jgi:hypothetical protein
MPSFEIHAHVSLLRVPEGIFETGIVFGVPAKLLNDTIRADRDPNFERYLL